MRLLIDRLGQTPPLLAAASIMTILTGSFASYLSHPEWSVLWWAMALVSWLFASLVLRWWGALFIALLSAGLFALASAAVYTGELAAWATAVSRMGHVAAASLFAAILLISLRQMDLLALLARGPVRRAFLLSAAGRIRWASPAVTELLKAQRGRVTGRLLTDLLPPEVGAAVTRALQTGLHDGEFRSPVFMADGGGAPQPIAVRLVPLDPSKCGYVLGELVPAVSLSLHDQLFTSALNAVDIALSLRTLDGQTIWCNAACWRASEQNRGRAGELDCTCGMPPDILPEELKKAAAGQHREWEVALESGRILAGEIYPVLNADGHPMALLSLQRDVTERRLAQTRLAEAQKLAEIGELAAGVAHNMNNVLGTIAVKAELLRTAAPGRVQRIADDLTAAVQQGAGVLALLSRYAGLVSAPTLENVSLRTLAEGALDYVLVQAARQDIAVDLQVDPDLRAHADANRLHQILLNVLLNAVQAMPIGGSITISAAAEAPGRIALSITDTGLGIAIAHLEKLFTPFFTTRGGEGGTGLGLATSRTMARQMDGDIQVVSREGQGTTVTVVLPAAR